MITKRSFKPTSSNFPNSLLIPTNSNSQDLYFSLEQLHENAPYKGQWSVWRLLPRDRIASNPGQRNRAEPHLLDIRQCLLSENNVHRGHNSERKHWCGVFSSPNTTEGYSDISDEYHIKISYSVGFSKKPKACHQVCLCAFLCTCSN